MNKLYSLLALFAGFSAVNAAHPNVHFPSALPIGTVVPGKIKVKFTPWAMTKLSRTGRAPVGLQDAKIDGTINSLGWTVWSVSEYENIPSLVKRLKATSGVVTAEPVYAVHTLLGTPNDGDWNAFEFSDNLYIQLDPDFIDYFKVLWPLDEVNAFSAWSNWPNTYYTNLTKPAHAPTVCVIDSGIDFGHPEFKNAGATSSNKRLGGQLDFERSKRILNLQVVDGEVPIDENGHGTHVAGTALAAANNGSFNFHGMIGTGYACQGMILKIIDAEGNGLDSDAAAAIIYAADHGADVINMSFGTQDFSSMIQDACTYAFQKGCVLVGAGNEADPPTNLPPIYPGASSSVIGVTASTGAHLPATDYAGTGTYLDMAAPGGDLVSDQYGNILLMFTWSTMPTYNVTLNGINYFPPIENNYTYLIGTSMAAPHVSGAAGMVFGKFGLSGQGGWANVRVMQDLERGAFGSATGWNTQKGWGDLNMQSTMLEQNYRNATNGSIEGIVYEGTPAVSAVITAKKIGTTTTFSTNSNSSGSYRFGALSEGTYEVTAKRGTNTKVRYIVVKKGCNNPGADFWIGGNPSDQTAPEIGRFELSTAPTTAQIQIKHWAYDVQTGIDKMTLQVGTTKGGSDVKAATEIYIDGDVATITGLAMTSGTNYWVRGTYTNGAGLSKSIDLQVMAGGTLRTISGTFTLEGLSEVGYAKNAVIEVRPHGSLNALETHPIPLSATGAYSFKTTATGTFDIAAKAMHWLRKRADNVSVAGAGVSNLNFSLKNGDVDGDNSVTIFDYITISDAFETIWGGDRWNAMADLDHDDTVTIFDYILMSDNFDKSGDD